LIWKYRLKEYRTEGIWTLSRRRFSEEHNCPIRYHNDGLLDGLGCMLTSFHNTFIAPNHYLPQNPPEIYFSINNSHLQNAEM